MKRILALMVSLALLLGGAAISESAEPSGGDDLKRIVEEWSPYGLAFSGRGGRNPVFHHPRGWEHRAFGVLRSAARGYEHALAEINGDAVYVAKDGAIYYLSGSDSRLLTRWTGNRGIRPGAGPGFENATLKDSMSGLLVSGLISSGVYASSCMTPRPGRSRPRTSTRPPSIITLELLKHSDEAGGLKLRVPAASGAGCHRAVAADGA
jgi:hypothetical protein